MDRSSQDSQGFKLESQIREAFGKVTYTQTCHDKIIKRLLKRNETIKVIQIILAAMTTGGFLITILSSESITAVTGAILSFILLALNTYSKNNNLVEIAQKHQHAADLLWKIREEYLTLLTDFEVLEQNEIMDKRDELQSRTYEVYSNSPRTDEKSYIAAKKALKTEEEQTFSEKEIDVMLPNSIRRNKKDLTE